MSSAIHEIATLASSKKGAPKDNVIESVWKSIADFVYQTVKQGKGCNLPNFGTFTFHSESMYIGTTGTNTKKIPMFKVNSSFSTNTGAKVRNTLADTPNIPVLNLSFVVVGTKAGVGKDVCETAYRFFLQGLTELLNSGRSITLDCGAANLTFSAGGNTTVKFKEGMGGECRSGPASKAAPQRAGSANATTSSRAVVKPSSPRSNTPPSKSTTKTNATPKRASVVRPQKREGSAGQMQRQSNQSNNNNNNNIHSAFSDDDGYPMEEEGPALNISKAPISSSSSSSSSSNSSQSYPSGQQSESIQGGDEGINKWLAQKTKRMESSVLKPIDPSQSNLPSTVCAVCGRKSKHLPYPNLCSLCYARRKQIEEKRAREMRELEEDAKYQQYLQEKDKIESEKAKTADNAYKQHRLDADRANEDMIQQHREIQRELTTGTVSSALEIQRGFVQMGDLFEARRKEEEEAEKSGEKNIRKQEYLQQLKKQMNDKSDVKRKEREEELEAARIEREIQRRKDEEDQQREKELKEIKGREKREALLRQMREEKVTMPAQVGYGKDGDVFTQQESEEEIAQRKHDQQHIIQHALKEQINSRQQQRKEEEEQDRILGEQSRLQERQMMEETAEREIAQRQRSSEIYRNILQRQMAQREKERQQLREQELAEDKNAYDTFTANEGDEEEMKRRKKENALRTAKGLDAMLEEQQRRKMEEREAEERYGKMVKELDAKQLEMEKAKELERKRYTSQAREELRKQMNDREQQRRMEREENRKSAVSITSLTFAGDEEEDCEEQPYRRKPLTKQQKMALGLL